MATADLAAILSPLELRLSTMFLTCNVDRILGT